jgi:broad specificity phosphatase PhoE
MLVYLIRHGETAWNVERRCQGFSDTPLNDTGRGQAAALARSLCDAEIEGFYSSTLSRAQETAATIAKCHGAEVQTRDGFRELNQGEFEGLTIKELGSNHGDFLKRWMQDPADLQLPGGESLRQVQIRAREALELVVEKHPQGNVVVVGHNLCNLALLCSLMHLELTHFRRLHQDVATVNVVEFGGRWPHPVVLRLNDTSHL